MQYCHCRMIQPLAKELLGTSLGSRAKAWPPGPGSIGIICAILIPLSVNRLKLMLRRNKMQFEALNLNVKPAFGLVFV